MDRSSFGFAGLCVAVGLLLGSAAGVMAQPGSTGCQQCGHDNCTDLGCGSCNPVTQTCFCQINNTCKITNLPDV